MFNYATWLRLIQVSSAARAHCQWPYKRVLKPCNQSHNYSKSSKQKQEQKKSSRGDKFKALTDQAKFSPKLNKKRSRWYFGYTIFLGSIFASVLWAIFELGQPEQDQFGRSIEDELSSLPLLQQYLQRMWHSIHYYQKMLMTPQTKLLPDEVCAPYIQPEYTLVLEMRDVLVHPDWTYQTGWRFKKRPGVEYFLRKCSKHFEIIAFTTEQGVIAFPILDALDPNGYIIYRLVHNATQLLNGQPIKNLDHLNRNLRRVIVIDWNPCSVPLHPDNIFAILRWQGNDDDLQLFDLAAFLELIAEHKIDDVREVLHYYRQFEDPIEQFKENQRKLLEMKQEKSG